MAASMVGAPFALAEKAARYLLSALPKPEVAVVLGSGWRGAAEVLGPPVAAMPMAYLPGLAPPTVAGHAGTVSSVQVGGRAVLLLVGRSHLYEGRSPAEVVHGVRTAVMAGARAVVLTNGAGSLRADFQPGQVVVVRDHLNLTGVSPLSGEEPPAPLGPRFVDLTDLYCARLREVARRARPDVPEGVYAALGGPHYETPAEVAMLRVVGADLVGMSTALEAIAARHLGAEVLALSLVTNLAAGLSGKPLDHAEVLAAGEGQAPRLGLLLAELLALL